MEFEKMITETREVSQILQAATGSWDGAVQVAHLAGVVGRLTDDVLSIEGKLPISVEDGRFAHNLADALFHLIRLGNMYHIDIERSWTEFLEQGRMRLGNEAMVTALRDAIHQNLERRQQS